jgi:hypothetical protein
LGNEIDLIVRDAVNALEQLRARYAHHDETVGQPPELFDHRALCRIRSGQHSVECRDDRHPHLPQQREQVGTGLAAENPVLSSLPNNTRRRSSGIEGTSGPAADPDDDRDGMRDAEPWFTLEQRPLFTIAQTWAG